MKLQFCILAALVIVCSIQWAHGSSIPEGRDRDDFTKNGKVNRDIAVLRRKRFIDFGLFASLALTAGLSLAGTTTNALVAQTGFSVTVGIEMDNFSKWPLTDPRATPNSGYISKPPTIVTAGTKEAMIGHKTGSTATGTSGVVSWKVTTGSGSYRINIMWSVPYSHDFHSNWLGIGIREDESSNPSFDSMYNGVVDATFLRREYYYDTETIHFCKYGFCVYGNMGTSHKSVVMLYLIPESPDDLAPSVKKEFDEKNQ